MAQAVKKCEKGKDPRKCTPRQIKECHGETAKHACGTAGARKGK